MSNTIPIPRIAEFPDGQWIILWLGQFFTKKRPVDALFKQDQLVFGVDDVGKLDAKEIAIGGIKGCFWLHGL